MSMQEETVARKTPWDDMRKEVRGPNVFQYDNAPVYKRMFIKPRIATVEEVEDLKWPAQL